LLFNRRRVCEEAGEEEGRVKTKTAKKPRGPRARLINLVKKAWVAGHQTPGPCTACPWS